MIQFIKRKTVIKKLSKTKLNNNNYLKHYLPEATAKAKLLKLFTVEVTGTRIPL